MDRNTLLLSVLPVFALLLVHDMPVWAQTGNPTQIDPASFPPVPRQLTVKVEMVLPEEKFVEEFVVFWDEELNLARYDYALGRIMAPFNTSRPMKTIHDYNNGMKCEACPQLTFDRYRCG